MANSKKTTIKVTAKPKSKNKFTPKMSSNNGGILIAKVIASVNKNKK